MYFHTLNKFLEYFLIKVQVQINICSNLGYCMIFCKDMAGAGVIGYADYENEVRFTGNNWIYVEKTVKSKINNTSKKKN